MSAAARKHVLCEPEVYAPWADTMVAHLASQLGTDQLSLRAISLISSSLAPNTYRSYDQKLQKFAMFCNKQGKQILDCELSDVLRYVAWLAEEGRVAADSIQPYLSAINKLYLDLGLPAIASGRWVKNAVRGMHFQQRLAVPHGLYRTAIPAVVIYDILTHLPVVLSADCSLLDRLKRARACLVTVMAFLFCARPGAMAQLLDSHLVVTPGPSSAILLTPWKTKGQAHVQPHLVEPVAIPAAAFTAPSVQLNPVDIAALVQQYKVLRNFSLQGQVPEHMWALPGEGTHKYSAKHVDAWLEQALQLTDHQPPAGYNWTGHSMRKGAASAAAAAGVPLSKIRYLGGWSAQSITVEKTYIDPTCPASPAGTFFFSWLT